MKKFLPLAVIACALALCFGLIGCGGGGGAIDEKAFVGEYKLTELTEDGDAVSQDDLDMLAAFGMEFGLTLNADHSASLTFFGESVDGTWKATAADKGEIVLSEFGSGTFTLQKDTLVMESGSDKMTFTKKS